MKVEGMNLSCEDFYPMLTIQEREHDGDAEKRM